MANGVFIDRSDSLNADQPAFHYQFPKQYLGRASKFVGDWIIYYEPAKAGGKGYNAIAKVEQIVPDPTAESRYLAIIEAGSYLPFEANVPFRVETEILERGLLNEDGNISGRAQSAVREISLADFNRIFDYGFPPDKTVLPRVDTEVEQTMRAVVQEERAPFQFQIERDRVAILGSRLVRDRVFRKTVLDAYDCRCAMSGLKFINGGGRAEVEAAHIRPVEHGGPDVVNNGLALSGTVHWMFDRGLISLSDDLDILVSRQVNDVDSVWSLLGGNRTAAMPISPQYRPHPRFLAWHREHCFKR